MAETQTEITYAQDQHVFQVTVNLTGPLTREVVLSMFEDWLESASAAGLFTVPVSASDTVELSSYEVS